MKNYLSEKDPLLKEAFEKMPRLRCSVNQEMATDRHHVKDGDEVAFFPPVTGG
ncbi:MoaD/ThiS family protein [Turicimonas muris]|uniref:MoaD/ThiS family protein n=1 Tax=Turicimonas muris TaxID=1796652 RepID=UPI0026356E29|nr:MoaD/ThiS family protein [Turicimonas muris]